MTAPSSPQSPSQSSSSEETLPPGSVVRWLLLAGVVLVSVGLYFRFGLHAPPLGTAPADTAATSTP